MPGLEIQPFSEEHLDASGELLAERHRRHRQAEPLLTEPAGLPSRGRDAVARRTGLGRRRTAGRADRGLRARHPKRRRALGAERLGRPGRACGGARGRSPRPLRRCGGGLGRAGPNPALRACSCVRRPVARGVVPAELRPAAGARDQRDTRCCDARERASGRGARHRGAGRARAAPFGSPGRLAGVLCVADARDRGGTAPGGDRRPRQSGARPLRRGGGRADRRRLRAGPDDALVDARRASPASRAPYCLRGP